MKVVVRLANRQPGLCTARAIFASTSGGNSTITRWHVAGFVKAPEQSAHFMTDFSVWACSMAPATARSYRRGGAILAPLGSYKLGLISRARKCTQRTSTMRCAQARWPW